MGLTDNFDRLNAKKKGDEQKTDDTTSRPSTSGIRNLCFIQPNGTQKFLNYAYLISGDYSPDDNTVILTYTTHIVTIKGYNLDVLYQHLFRHEVEIIQCEDDRYAGAENQAETIVTLIEIKTLTQ